MNFFGRGATYRQQVQDFLLQKRLHHIAPDLKPVPNPLSREYLLMVQQYSRLAFVDSMEVLKVESGMAWWMRLVKCFIEYLRLKATTAIVNSLILEHRLTQGLGDDHK
jgi:hypothetical protein